MFILLFCLPSMVSDLVMKVHRWTSIGTASQEKESFARVALKEARGKILA
ncbi:MAG: hypothetical protein LBF22_13955 [Deltaproteobacteria bacterium]|nr:hypothetical protein [Deltaproteobacteria bacterium]